MPFLQKIVCFFKKLSLRHYSTLGLIAILMLLLNYKFVSIKHDQCIQNSLNKIKEDKVGLVLGTCKYLSGKKSNPFYDNRINAAAQLFFSGKIKYILVSGDNQYLNYNEPRMMKNDLIAKGVPEKAIFMDFAGFRTLDSIVRAKKVFGLKHFIIISQKFHNERALFIAKHFGIDAQAYNAIDPSSQHLTKVIVREFLARVKLFLDLYILHTPPKFLGKKIAIV